MNKAVYKRYLINLRGKEYDILVPDKISQKLWLDPAGYFYRNSEGSDLFGERFARQTICNAFVTLALQPDKIIYFPLESSCPSHKWLHLNSIPQIVFYNRSVQLKRREWRVLLKIIKGGYIRPKEYVVYFDPGELEKRYELMLHQWKKNKTYYKRYQIKEYYQYNTIFLKEIQKMTCKLL